MAQARAAAAHQCATLDACRHAWAAKVNAGREMQRAADANGRVVGGGSGSGGSGGSGAAGGGGQASKRAIAETAAAMHRAVDALEGAAVEFSQAARLSGAAADWWARAAAALGRSGLAGAERAARERGEEARKMARTLDDWAGNSRHAARKLGAAAAGWVEDTADWEDGCRMDGGGRDEWMASRDAMREAADGERAMAEDMERQTAGAARVAAGELARVAADSDRRAAAARGELEGEEGGPGAREAAAAWKEGMEAAERAARGR